MVPAAQVFNIPAPRRARACCTLIALIRFTFCSQKSRIRASTPKISGAARAHGHIIASICLHSCTYALPDPALHLLPRAAGRLAAGLVPLLRVPRSEQPPCLALRSGSAMLLRSR